MEGFTQNPVRYKGQVSSTKMGPTYTEQMVQGVRYQGVFDLNELYKIIHDWLTARGYQVQESKYKSIALSDGGKERSFDWNAHRKANEFVMLHLNIHFQVQDLHTIVVERNDEKKNLTKGRLFIRVTQDLEYDFSERFAYSKFHKILLNFLGDFMWSKKIETYWEDKQRFKAYELVNLIKETLDFMTKGNEHFDVW